MADTPFPLPQERRQTDVLSGNGGATYGPFVFRIFDLDDVTAYIRPDAAHSFEPVDVIVTKVSGLPLDYFTVTFPDNLPNTSQFVIAGMRLGERSAGVRRGTAMDIAALEKELSKLVAQAQELRRDIDRAVSVDFGNVGQVSPAPSNGHVLGWYGGRLANLDPDDFVSLAGVAAIDSSVFRIASLAAAPDAIIPDGVTRAMIQQRRAFYAEQTSEPAHNEKFQNAGKWWGLDEPFIDASMAGAKADNGVTDNAGVQAALSLLGMPIRWPKGAGAYYFSEINFSDRTDFFDIQSNGAVFKKLTNDDKPLVQINNASEGAAGYVPRGRIRGVVFDGDHKATYGVLAYSIARWKFEDCAFLNCLQDGFLQVGGAQTQMDRCDAIGNGRAGIAFDRYDYGFPNANVVSLGGIFDNGKYGVYFDGGRILELKSCDIEGNGEADNPATAGVWVGDLVGTEAGTTRRPGITISGGWIEGNKGKNAGPPGFAKSGAVRFGSGYNRIIDAYFCANQTYCDVHAEGGTYDIIVSTFDGARVHVVDGTNVGNGNMIFGGSIGGSHEINVAKTAVYGPKVSGTVYTPTLGSDAGTIGGTSFTPTASFTRVNKHIFYRIALGVSAVGTATGDVLVSLPVAPRYTNGVTVVLDDGKLAAGRVIANTTTMRLTKADGTTLFTAPFGLVANGWYEIN